MSEHYITPPQELIPSLVEGVSLWVEPVGLDRQYTELTLSARDNELIYISGDYAYGLKQFPDYKVGDTICFREEWGNFFDGNNYYQCYAEDGERILNTDCMLHAQKCGWSQKVSEMPDEFVRIKRPITGVKVMKLGDTQTEERRVIMDGKKFFNQDEFESHWNNKYPQINYSSDQYVFVYELGGKIDE